MEALCPRVFRMLTVSSFLGIGGQELPNIPLLGGTELEWISRDPWLLNHEVRAQWPEPYSIKQIDPV